MSTIDELPMPPPPAPAALPPSYDDSEQSYRNNFYNTVQTVIADDLNDNVEEPEHFLYEQQLDKHLTISQS
ncbi:hypothetical protein WICPIJ_007985 [Wickerhamomyces pijperi]|uniref:Uncharacterized protein n=1 Tax=Wickerhamomyces pijperi TaxID=599730 RepID=A0A9P8PZ92_WICPI|nr:hypothetical protein WICPIJ_007985 [Wickerhamomyces pijperi]